jgi:hypothetical protein
MKIFLVSQISVGVIRLCKRLAEISSSVDILRNSPDAAESIEEPSFAAKIVSTFPQEETALPDGKYMRRIGLSSPRPTPFNEIYYKTY